MFWLVLSLACQIVKLDVYFCFHLKTSLVKSSLVKSITKKDYQTKESLKSSLTSNLQNQPYNKLQMQTIHGFFHFMVHAEKTKHNTC